MIGAAGWLRAVRRNDGLAVDGSGARGGARRDAAARLPRKAEADEASRRHAGAAERLPIIAFAPNPWDTAQWMNRQQLLSRFAARGWRVVYSTGASDVWQRGTPAWSAAPAFGSVVAMNGVLVDRPGRFPPRWQKSAAWDGLAVGLHARRLKAAAGVHGNAMIALLFHPMFWPYVEALEPRFVAFHVYDIYSRMHEWSAELDRMQDRLVDRADVVTASSAGMAEPLPGKGPGKATILPNGVDAGLFLEAVNAPCPPDLARIPHPRIAYAGSVNRKVDLRMIASTARRRPDWHWVLIGPTEEEALNAELESSVGLAGCLAMPNVHFLGTKPRDAIPAYLAHMDVNTICYRLWPGDWIEAGYPLKLHEYLAVGKPVVAAPLAVMTQFASVVDIARSDEAWLTAIERALSSGGVGTPAERQAVALQNTWDARADRLERLYLDMISGRSRQQGVAW